MESFNFFPFVIYNTAFDAQLIWNFIDLMILVTSVVDLFLYLFPFHGFKFILQEKLCKANKWQNTQPTTDVVSLLSDIKIGTGKNDCWPGIRTANIPAVMAAAAAASGENLKLTEAFNLEVLNTSIVSATAKCNHAGEIAGMRRLYNSIGGFQTGTMPTGLGIGGGLQRLISGAFSQPSEAEDDSFNEMLLSKFVRLLQQFVNIAEKSGEVDKSKFRETCTQATALLLSNLVIK